jgi:hypothetical protein
MNIDPRLNQYHYNIASPLSQEQLQDVATPPVTGMKSIFTKKAVEAEGVKYHVSIMHEGRRIVPKFTLTPNTCSGFSSLVQHIHSITDDDGRTISSIQALVPSGLMDVTDEGTWSEAIETVKQHEWMDGEVKCIVQVE